MNKIGRNTIYANYSEDELLSLDSESQKNAVLDIITNAIELHNENAVETLNLFKFWSGEQDIQSKKKETREKINNKITENWAYAFVDFKKNWLLSKPIQYVASNSSCSKELSSLNKYCQVANVASKNQQWYADALICGRGFKYNAPIKVSDDYEAPFEVINIDPESCEVVYSSQIGHEQLLSFIKTSMVFIDSSNPEKEKKHRYSEYTVYLRNKKYVLSDKSGALQIIDEKTTPLIVNKHYITELYLNKERISLIEFGKDLFNGVNLLESLDMDDLEQFVNAYMVFTNAEFTEDDLRNIKKLGAISINSSDSKPAKVELLSQKLDANTTQSYYSRLLTSLHNILGIPKSGESGSASYGDTGQARLLSQGYTFAEIRIMGDQVMIEQAERECLSTILKICKSKTSEIKNLQIGDIAFNFQIDKSDNMLTKSETLLNLKTAEIPREIRNSVINLFSDPNAVTEAQEETFGPEKIKEEKNNNSINTETEQNNQEENEKEEDIPTT